MYSNSSQDMVKQTHAHLRSIDAQVHFSLRLEVIHMLTRTQLFKASLV